MLGRHNIICLLLKAHEIELYNLGTKEHSTITIPSNVVDHMEVLDKDGFYSIVSEWTKTRSYVSSEIICFIAGELCFETSFPDSDKLKWDTQTVHFLDSVPFEEVLSKVNTPTASRQVIACNKDLVNTLIQSFSFHGYTTSYVIPATQFMLESLADPVMVAQAVSKQSRLIQESFMFTKPILSTPQSSVSASSDTNSGEKPKSQLPLLLGVFGVLLVILIIVIVLM